MLPELTPNQILTCARTYKGTPYHHAARVKGVGIDCIGLLACVMEELGVPVEDRINYTGFDEFDQLVSSITQYFDTVEGDMIAGDVLVFRGFKMMNHCGFANGEGGLIHTWNASAVQQVSEHGMDDYWHRCLAGHFRYKNIKI